MPCSRAPCTTACLKAILPDCKNSRPCRLNCEYSPILWCFRQAAACLDGCMGDRPSSMERPTISVSSRKGKPNMIGPRQSLSRPQPAGSRALCMLYLSSTNAIFALLVVADAGRDCCSFSSRLLDTSALVLATASSASQIQCDCHTRLQTTLVASNYKCLRTQAFAQWFSSLNTSFLRWLQRISEMKVERSMKLLRLLCARLVYALERIACKPSTAQNAYFRGVRDQRSLKVAFVIGVSPAASGQGWVLEEPNQANQNHVQSLRSLTSFQECTAARLSNATIFHLRSVRNSSSWV